MPPAAWQVRSSPRAVLLPKTSSVYQIEQDYPGFVRCHLGEGSSDLALYPWSDVAGEAGVSAVGSGFRGISLHYLTDSRDEVDEVIRAAEMAGGTVIKAAAAADWGGYAGFFADPDGYL